METAYFPFPRGDGSRISVQAYERLDQVEHLTAQRTVPPHRHAYYELVLILRGACKHVYQGMETPLLPGDFFLVPPHRPHAYQFQEDVVHCNCQFYLDALGGDWADLVHGIQYDQLQRDRDADPAAYTANINRQGIIHLGAEGTAHLRSILEQMLSEQRSGLSDAGLMQRSLLEMLLVSVSRAQARQFANAGKYDSWKQRMIAGVLRDFEQDLAADWDFEAIARRQGVSDSYFRMIFKDITGLPPRKYLNRLKIVKAVDLLSRHGLSIGQAAERVGLYDLNYFARLCKQVMGYPPKHFKAT